MVMIPLATHLWLLLSARSDNHYDLSRPRSSACPILQLPRGLSALNHTRFTLPFIRCNDMPV
jgi:hypothetical protein